MNRGMAFIGTWRLVSFENRMSCGEKIYPLGEDHISSYRLGRAVCYLLFGLEENAFESRYIELASMHNKPKQLTVFMTPTSGIRSRTK